jgi:hypothetical protein
MWWKEDHRGETRTNRVASMKRYASLLLIMAIRLLFVSGVVEANAQCIPPPSGMTAWWPLDETAGPTANDIATGGVNNAGTWMNSPVPVTGMVAGALSFSGSNSVDVPDQAELNFGTGDFSIDLWIKTTAASGAKPIVDKRTGSVPNVTGYILFLSNGYLGSQIGDGAGYNNCVTTAGFVADGNWHHVAVTVDRNNTSGWRHYVDGSAVATPCNPTGYQGSLTNTAPFVMARNLLTPSQTFAGTLDEIDLFNRVLDSTEIRSIWAAGSFGKCKDTCYATGDIDGNGTPLTVADLSYLVAFLHGTGPAPNPLYLADLDGNCFIDTFDINKFQCYLSSGMSCFPTYPVPTCCNVSACPLVYDAPWAAATLTSTVPPYQWHVKAVSTPMMYNKSFSLFGRSWLNSVGLNGQLDHDINDNTNSTIGITTDNIVVELMDHQFLNFNLPSTVTEVPAHTGSPNHVINWTLGTYTKTFPKTSIGCFNYDISNPWGLPFSLGVSGNLYTWGLGRAAIALQAPGPTYGTAGVRGEGKLDASVSIVRNLWLAKLKGTAGVVGNVAVKALLAIQSGAPQLTFDHCIDVDAYLEAAYKWRWGKWHSVRLQWNLFTSGTCPLPPPPKGTTTNPDSVWFHIIPEDSVWYELPSAARSVNGQKVMAAFIHADAASSENLYYSLYAGKGWSAPIKGSFDNLPKRDVSLTAFGASKFAAGYVQSSNPGSRPDSVSMTTLVNDQKTQEINVAMYNDVTNTWAVTPITSDTYPDGFPDIAGSSNRIYLTFLRNTSGDPMNADSQKVYFTMYKQDTGWIPIKRITTQVGMSLDPQVAIDASNGTACIVYIEDTDANLSTPIDRRLRMVRIDANGNETGGVTTVPTSLGPTDPALAISSTGGIVTAYSYCSFIRDTNEIVYDTSGFGDLSVVGTSIMKGGGWGTYPVGNTPSTIHGALPKLVISEDTAHLIYRSLEFRDSLFNDGELSHATFNLTGGSEWSSPNTLTDDTYRTWPADAVLDQSGALHIFYQNETGVTPTFPHGWDQIYDTTIASYVPGDMNHDGQVNITDAVYGITYIFAGGPAPNPLGAGDVDCNGFVNISDVVYLINYIFSGGPAPNANCKGGSSPADGGAILNRLAPKTATLKLAVSDDATTSVKLATVNMHTDAEIAGAQLEFKVSSGNVGDVVFQTTERTRNLQLFSGVVDGKLRVGLVDMSGEQVIAAGDGPILSFDSKGGETDLELISAVVCDRNAKELNVSIESIQKESTLPKQYSLSQNYPNPFNPSTEIAFAMPKAGEVRIDVINMLGQTVKTLTSGVRAAGNHRVTWDGTNEHGNDVSSGVYFYRIVSNDYTTSKKMVLLK